MASNMFRPKMADKKFLEKFEIILDDQVGIYGIVMEKVRSELGLTDDRAVQAAAFTVWKQTMGTLGSLSPGAMFWAPSDDPAENLKNFEQYAAWYGSRADAFVVLCDEYAGMEEGGTRLVLRSIEMSKSQFDKVKDFLALADIVNVTSNVMTGHADEEDEAVIEEIRMLNAKAFGQKIGKSVDEILGGTE